MPSLHIVLVEPEIHWNTGNVGRTALAVDATLHLVEPLGFSLDVRQVRRAGLDYWERVRLRVWPSWSTLQEQLATLGTPYLFSASASRSYWDVTYPADTVLVFGKESAGLPRELVARHAERALRIPMAADGPRSLNLSTTAALVAYEVLRQRQLPAP
jgi:tRNA (cytidine/uridine-2'-O-)-methyltransferase